MRKNQQKSGFALIISLSLMAFVLLLILSFSVIVQVESQTSTVTVRTEQAKRNALLGLYVAMGEIQQNLGADQRVTATAAIFDGVDESKQHLTGVWSSAAGAQVGGQTYQAGDFMRWLSSGSGGETWYRGSLSNDAVVLVGAGSLADSNGDGVADDAGDVVAAEREPIIENLNGSDVVGGHYAWWVGDEGVKARINIEDQSAQDASTNKENKLNAVMARNSSGRSEVGALSGLNDVDVQDVRLVNRLSEVSDLALGISGDSNAQNIVNGYFHDLTTVSAGVLADVKNGGLKQDLSLAFEMSDSDFNDSVFGKDGPDTVMSTGFGRVQPIFRAGPNADANGPTWHVLRDYYSIYKRMENVMTDPVFDAQALAPNNGPGGLPGIGGLPLRKNLAAMRYISDDAVSDGVNGDPLRSDGGALPIPVMSSYLPYVQRHLSSVGALFKTMPTVPAGKDPSYDWQEMQLRIRASIVTHNPYNVKIRHLGMASAFGVPRFNARIQSELDPTLVFDSKESKWSEHVLKTEPDVMDAGEIKAYSGVGQTDTSRVSESVIFEEDDFLLLKSKDANAFLGWKFPAEKVDPSPNLLILTEPYDDPRGSEPSNYTYYAYHSLIVEDKATSSIVWDDILDADGFHNYAGFHTKSITSSINSVEDWYGGEEGDFADAYAINTKNFPFEFGKATDVLPVKLIEFDVFLKPAGYHPRYNPNPYPGLSHTNPLAPIWQSSNLFDTDPSGGIDTESGYPVFAPSWQFSVSRSGPFDPETLKFPTHGGSEWNAYWGATNTQGSTEVSAIELPTSPPISMGQFQNANISLYSHMPALAIGNSFASLYVPRDSSYTTYSNSEGKSRAFYDLSYLSNEVLWDAYFFSSYSVPYDAGRDDFGGGTVRDTFDAAFDSQGNDYTGELPNPRMVLQSPGEELSDLKSKLFESSGEPAPLGYKRSAENLMVRGAFNVNSVSKDAWKAVLSATRNIPVYVSSAGVQIEYTADSTPISRISLPAHGEFVDGDVYNDKAAWGGVGTLSDAEIDALASAIVAEVELRIQAKGRPYISMAEFVNRELANDSTGLVGLLQAAIDKSDLNSHFETPDAMQVDAGSLDAFPVSGNISGASLPSRSTATSASAYLLQADILQAIGSFSSVRSDTFRIRSYGDAVDPVSGNTVRAWCEAVIQRVPKPVEGRADDPSNVNYWDPLDRDVGRDFSIISFRWLNEDEV